MKRSSGVIMHISSLPSPYGIGTFGEAAYQFVDFLNKSRQKYWQILPLGHTSYGDSPYQAFSAFAGNPYFVDLDRLVEEGLLTKEEIIEEGFSKEVHDIDFGTLFYTRYRVLRKAFNRAKVKERVEIDTFVEKNKEWLKDYAMYMAIKEKMKLVSWQEWEEGLKQREEKVLAMYEQSLAEEIRFWSFIQYKFYQQWEALKSYTNALGIEIIGDLPIYVSSDSSDAWANSKMFKLDDEKNPIVVAGCPPDAFSDTGQLWGNPIYDWEHLEETGYVWWINRIRESLKLFDMIRIDHFRGFESYWEIPYGEKTAINGKWVKGPEMKLFDAIKDALGNVKIIAEDLGYLTQEVLDFRDETGYPGMKVLQFAFDPVNESDYIPHTYAKHCVVYTGTHDNDTIRGWMESTGEKGDVEYAIDYLKLTKEEGYSWGYIRGVWSSIGDIAITTMQDLLDLGNECRMNLPSTLGENWKWRMKPDALTEELAEKLCHMTKIYGRCK